MTSIGEAVEAKLAAQRAGDDAVALWRRLWALHEAGGREAVEEALRELLEDPSAAPGVGPEEG